MAEQIFVKKGEMLEPVDEEKFEREDDLQALLAKHPRLLGNARRWLLVTREKEVADAPDGAGRWSLDHLFVDQDAVPTLVEVKRGSNTQIRREVVGQMLDYAANGSGFGRRMRLGRLSSVSTEVPANGPMLYCKSSWARRIRPPTSSGARLPPTLLPGECALYS